MIIVADAGPLIAFAKTELLLLLPQLFTQVLVSPAVYAELRVDDNRPGSRALRLAIAEQKWLEVVSLKEADSKFHSILDEGEAEAIQLALEQKAVLLIDERRGRNLARKQGISIIGSGKVLVAAKQRGIIPSVNEALEKLSTAGYRLSPTLCEKLKAMADE